MRWFPIAILTNGIHILTRAGFELITPVPCVRMLNHYTTAPLTVNCSTDYIRTNIRYIGHSEINGFRFNRSSNFQIATVIGYNKLQQGSFVAIGI